MVVVYLGLGLLLLLSPPDDLIPNETARKTMGAILLIYGLFRGFQAWQKLKEIKKGNDH